ncbi:MAG: class I SAM-dependent methyltransferase [Lachnospiraceae bacterium]|nr:class I SAM-dependent methyltransferase [Lachnospiraceae bacterium]
MFLAEWFVDNPENFDHEIDLYWQWDAKCVPYWLERGVYSVQALKIFDNPIVIELCCGDGFNAKHFYSTSADKIFACDFDKAIIRTAKRKNKRDNIVYKVADIRDGINKIIGGG